MALFFLRGFAFFVQGLRPYGLVRPTPGLCRGLVSSLTLWKPWADGLRPFYPPSVTWRPIHLAPDPLGARSTWGPIHFTALV